MRRYDAEARFRRWTTTDHKGKDGSIVFGGKILLSCLQLPRIGKIQLLEAGADKSAAYCVDCEKVARTAVEKLQQRIGF